MKRLFTFGCSYTSYAFPTWADLLAIDYKQSENWGVAGIGCRGISERVAECHAKNKISKDDVVIVQWTTHLRHDFYKTTPVKDRTLPWKTNGGLFNESNSEFYNREWVETFFDPFAFTMHSLNHILLTIEFLKSTGCAWYMTSIGDWQKLGSDLNYSGALADERIAPPITLEEEFPKLMIYVKPIWKDHAEHWITPIAPYANQRQDLFWYFDMKGKRSKEVHPSPEQYALWLNEHLRPKLNLGEPLDAQLKWRECLIREKENNYDLQNFAEYIRRQNSSIKGWPDTTWPDPYKGF